MYLRARFYNPANGRFQSRDTWAGNARLPMSLNRWNYTNSNAVNYGDPSGHFFPIWCQSMPTKASYELCVDLSYGIEPVYPWLIGENVTGSQGCYHGPIAYRAPGYIEGTGLTLAGPSITNWLFAIESVYDFATMQHNYFVNGSFGIPGAPGLGFSDFLFGVSGTLYAGYVNGLISSSSINADYPGPFVTGYIGVSGGPLGVDFVGPSAGVGKTGFFSASDPLIRGSATYIMFGIGLDPLTNVDVGIGVLSSVRVNKEPQKYLDKYSLSTDIMLGSHNVWLSRLNLLGYFSPIDMLSRTKAATKALWYGMVYEELHENK